MLNMLKRHPPPHPSPPSPDNPDECCLDNSLLSNQCSLGTAARIGMVQPAGGDGTRWLGV